MGGYAWVTLATNDAYSLGALVLAHSLRRVGTKYELAVLVTPGVTEIMREKLSAVFSVVMEVNVLDSKDEANLALLARPELGITFTKLHCWRLTQYDKCVFLDADTLVIRNCDELFEREELSAAPDVGWPDCFNSGVFVYKPSQQTFASITAFAAAKGSFDGGDQGLLNMYFSDWAHKDISKHLPFIYNMCSTATYSYLPAFKQFGDDVRIIHFIGITKPWLQYFDTLTGIVQPPMGSAHLQPLLQLWWNLFCEKVHPQLSPVMATSTLAPIWHEFTPMPYKSPTPKSRPIYTDVQDNNQSDIYIKTPDFSEFKDPWENYCVQNDPVICKKEDHNRTEQYYPTIDKSSPVTVLNDNYNSIQSVYQTHYNSPREHNNEFYDKQQHNKHTSSVSHSIQNYNHQQPNRFNENIHSSFLHIQQHQHHQEQPNQFSEIKHTSFSHIQHHHHQEQPTQFSENKHNSFSNVQHYNHEQSNQSSDNKQQHSHFHSKDSSVPKESDHWQNQNTIESYVPVHNAQSHYSTESQQHQRVDYQHQHVYHQHQHSGQQHQHVDHQHQHVDHQHVHQHSNNDNNKSMPEETKQHQHHEPYVDHQHSHHYQHNQHQVYDNVNNRQNNERYQQENQVFHSIEQTDFQCNKQDSSNMNVNHEQSTEKNIIYQNDHSTEQNTKQNNNITVTDEQTNTLISTSPHPVSKPCTDFHNVATQSDPHVTERLDSPNAGLAGALAQITLGEPRSAEQIALEEHMRKQSWEQGQIDYMGRDSFDNIWKKICQTLALAPPRLPSPPKEILQPATSETDKTVEPTEPMELVQPVEPTKLVQPAEPTELVQPTEPTTLIQLAEPTALVQPTESKDEVDKGTAQATSLTEEQSLDNNVPITKSENVSKLFIKDEQKSEKEQTVTNETIEDISGKSLTKLQNEPLDTTVDSSFAQHAIQPSVEKVAEEFCTSSLLKETPQKTTVPTVYCDLVQSQSTEEQKDELLCKRDSSIASTKKLEDNKSVANLEITVDTQQTVQSDIGDEKHAKELSTASEVLTVSPVPIQVAESVLQIEPKGSMSDSQIMTQEVLSTTITPVHEFNVPSSDSLTKAEEKLQMNGSASVTESVQNKEKLCSDTVATVESIDTANKLDESLMKSTETSQILQPADQSQPQLTQTFTALPSSITESKEAPTTMSVDKSLPQAIESVEQIKESESTKETVEPTESSSEPEVAKTSSSSESPVRPTRAKEINVPSTSVSKTPPTETTKNREKVMKKTVKKSTEKSMSEGDPTETTDGDGTGKKVVKKVVKKVTKKPKSKAEEALDDGAADSSSPSKTKKTVKVIKKSTKPLQTSETDAAAPETPSSSTSDTPVPPKRKTKATAKVVKKSDVE